MIIVCCGRSRLVSDLSASIAGESEFGPSPGNPSVESKQAVALARGPRQAGRWTVLGITEVSPRTWNEAASPPLANQ